MCGIAGIHIFNPDSAPKWNKLEHAVDNLFAAIDFRGGDATGFVAVSEEETIWQKASCNAFNFYRERKNLPYGVRSILLHTRMATQGLAAFPENNHPVRRGSVYVVHNGHIWNDNEIFRKTNRTRYGQVDSEAIAAIIAKYGIMQTHKAMEEVMGAAAIGVVDETRPGIMVLARGSSSPLMFYRNEDMAVFASTKDAVKKAWTVLYGTPPSDKKIEEVNEGTALYLDNNSVSKERFVPDDYIYVSDNSGWKNYGDYNDRHYKKYTGKGWDDSNKKLEQDEKTDSINGGKVFCSHMVVWENCEICNPDDEYGSFLPAKASDYDRPKIKDTRNEWVNAVQCELCDLWFAEDELTKVEDWEDKWVFCKTCMDEMAEVISDCDISKPLRIHDLPLEDNPLAPWHLRDDIAVRL